MQCTKSETLAFPYKDEFFLDIFYFSISDNTTYMQQYSMIFFIKIIQLGKECL